MDALLLLILLAAFESGLTLGPSAAMLAGTAHPDWRNTLTLNPALAGAAPRWSAAAGYTRPHGLAGVDQLGLAAAAGFGRWALVAGASQLGFDRYYERDFAVAGAFRPVAGLCAGAGCHLLTVTTDPAVTELAVALDAGVTWETGRLRVGAAAQRFNVPRLATGDDLPFAARAGVSVEPLDDLVVAGDAAWVDGEPELALGLELRLVPLLALRLGGRYPPLGYAAGVGLAAGPVEADYAFRYHPQLRDSHVFGVRVSCW